jgi:hypothetical protein
VWNILRVEKEHISNCGDFKAVEELILPIKNIEFECDDELELVQELK